MTEHSFGGPWTEIKLDTVVYYLECYTKALKAKNFDLWYVDGFAGTGDRTATETRGGIFEGGPVSTEIVSRAGSARRALNVSPAFDHFIFIDEKREHCEALHALRNEHSQKDVRIILGDANEHLRALVGMEAWRKKRAGNSRAVVFLDPYALQVDWATLESLAATQIVDVWYLFPLRDVTRQLAREYSGIGAKESKLTRVLGPNWRDLYQPPVVRQASLIDEMESTELVRGRTIKQIEEWFQGELRRIFPFVSGALPLWTEPGRQAFSLFLAVANDSAPAVNLAKHFVKHAMGQKPAKASRRRSDL
jgi:three-Cys-motif partner protein